MALSPEAQALKEKKRAEKNAVKMSKSLKTKRRMTEEKWLQAIIYYKSGHTTSEVCKKYKITANALFTQMRKRNMKREELSVDEYKRLSGVNGFLETNPTIKSAVEDILQDEDVVKAVKNTAEAIQAVPRTERALMAEVIADEKKKDIKKAIIERTNELDYMVKENRLDNRLDSTTMGLHLKVYDEVMNILKDKNPILAKNLSALVGKIMLRANDMLDDPKLKSVDLNNVANALSKINEIMQIVPKTQPLIAQQFNIGGGGNQEPKQKDFNINIEFIE